MICPSLLLYISDPLDILEFLIANFPFFIMFSIVMAVRHVQTRFYGLKDYFKAKFFHNGLHQRFKFSKYLVLQREQKLEKEVLPSK